MRTEHNTRITDRDAARLARIVEDLLRHTGTIESGAEALHDALDAARIVPSGEIDSDIVTMNSEVAIQDAGSGEERVIRETCKMKIWLAPEMEAAIKLSGAFEIAERHGGWLVDSPFDNGEEAWRMIHVLRAR